MKTIIFFESNFAFNLLAIHFCSDSLSLFQLIDIFLDLLLFCFKSKLNFSKIDIHLISSGRQAKDDIVTILK